MSHEAIHEASIIWQLDAESAKLESERQREK